MKQPHDAQVGWHVLVQNPGVSMAITDDKGYDWELLRTKLRAEGIGPLIPTRKKDLLGRVRNLLIDTPTYYKRLNTESVFFGLHGRYDGPLWVRTRVVNSADLSLNRWSDTPNAQSRIQTNEFKRLNKTDE